MMNLYLFDDKEARSWQPFNLTRPAGELLLGCLSMRSRAEAFWGSSCLGHITHDNLRSFDEPNSPPVIESHEMNSNFPTILFLSRAIPDFCPENKSIISSINFSDGPKVLVMNEEIVGWLFPKGYSSSKDINVFEPSQSVADFPQIQLSGNLLRNIWDLISVNGEQIHKDLERLHPTEPSLLPEGVTHSGENIISLEQNVTINPKTHLDSSAGPILISSGSHLRAFTHIVGPAFIGPGTHVLGGTMDCFSTGPMCKLRGEINNSVILGYTNKAHDGYLGNSYIGRWVNFGAFTTNSDLKNNYSEIRIFTVTGLANTGKRKLGIFVGDHVKTGIGSLLPAGCVIGCGTNIFGGGLAPPSIPPFSWGTSQNLEPYELTRFLQMVHTVMDRRDIQLSTKAEKCLVEAWEATHATT